MSTVGRSALVNHSAQQMFALVAEVESYPEFPALVRQGARLRARPRPHRWRRCASISAG